MADITKISVNGTSYNIKDAGAIRSHQDISGKYNTSDVGLTTVKATRGMSVSTATNGCWTAMCNATSSGSPKLPGPGWWHVISLDWAGNDPNNWFSQIAVSTQDGSGLWYRHNTPGGTNIDNASWIRLSEEGHTHPGLGSVTLKTWS